MYIVYMAPHRTWKAMCSGTAIRANYGDGPARHDGAENLDEVAGDAVHGDEGHGDGDQFSCARRVANPATLGHGLEGSSALV